MILLFVVLIFSTVSGEWDEIDSEQTSYENYQVIIKIVNI